MSTYLLYYGMNITETHTYCKNKQTKTYAIAHTCTLTHFLLESQMDYFPTATLTILAWLFTQPSLWYLATSCSVAAQIFIQFVSIYQQSPAVSEPPAAIFSSQNKGEHLTTRGDPQQTHINMSLAFFCFYLFEKHDKVDSSPVRQPCNNIIHSKSATIFNC